MKTAERRAQAIADLLGVDREDSAFGSILRSFQEHARDQRHLCAEAVNSLDASYADGEFADPALLADWAHARAMNARAPGE